MRKRYQLQVLMPWDASWYTLQHVGPWWTRNGAVSEMAKQTLLFPRDYRFQIIKDGKVVYTED